MKEGDLNLKMHERGIRYYRRQGCLFEENENWNKIVKEK